MSISLEQLRSALVTDAEATSAPVITANQRLDGVRRVVIARRRRRTGLIAAAAAVLLVGGVLVGTTWPGLSSHPRPSHRPQPVTPPTGLPTYHSGGRILGGVAVPLSKVGATTFTVTPTSYDLSLFGVCSGPSSYLVEVSIVGDPSGGSDGQQGASCGDQFGVGPSPDHSTPAQRETYWRGSNITPGRPVTISVVIGVAEPDGSAGQPTTASPPAVGTARVGLYQDVPLSSYPLPARPAGWRAPIASASELYAGRRAVTLPPGRSTGTWSGTITYTEDLAVLGSVSAPGLVRVWLNGQLASEQSFWTWDKTFYAARLGPIDLPQGVSQEPAVGSKAVVKVEFDRFTQPSWELGVGTRKTGG